MRDNLREGYHYGPGWYWFGKKLWGLLFRRYCRLRVLGSENIPRGGPAVVTANHLSMLDPFLVGYTLRSPHPIAFMGKQELFRIPLIGRAIAEWGAFPVDRTRKDASALRIALSVLKAGEILGMFPEGTRSTGGELQELRTGALRLAIRTRAPLIPVGIEGTNRSLPPRTKFPKPAKITVAYGPPLDLSALYDHRPTDSEIAACSVELGAALDRLHAAGQAPW
ncbi:MAG: lysophospholipid acyltransferase family protein [Chloroflexia bacterium]